MKLRQIAITASLLFSSHLAIGATYEVPDKQKLDLSDPFAQTSTPGSEADQGFFDLQLSDTQSKSGLRQSYIEIVKLIKNKQLKSAEIKINRLIKENPEDADTYNLRASLELLQKKNKLAIKSYQKAIELAPQNERGYLGLASVYLRDGDYSQAKEFADKALSINDKSTYGYILLAKIAFQEKKLQEIESILLTAQQKIKGDTQQEVIVASNLVKLYFIQKKPQKALHVAKDLIYRHPDESSALVLLVNVQILNAKQDQAIVTLEKLISKEPKDVTHRLLLARLLVNKPDKQQQVIHLLDEVKRIEPDNIEFQAKRAFLLTQLKLYPEALQAAKIVKQLGPETGMAEALEGEIYLAENKLDKALAAFQQSYKFKTNIRVLNVITKILMTQGKQADAIDFLSKELKKDPDNITIHFNLGNIYHRQNNLSKAEQHYQAILAKEPDNSVVLNNLAWIYHVQNNPQALSMAERAYHKAPKSAAIADTYAVIIIKQGDLTKGIKILKSAVELDPQNYEIQYHLADAYVQNGQKYQAVQILKPIVNSRQNFSQKEAARSLLKSLE